MRICVVGAGAIGGFLGAKLALAGEDVTLIARGPHLDAIRNNGLKLVMEDGEGDHYTTPHRLGGRTIIENGRMVHRKCHARGRPPEE